MKLLRLEDQANRLIVLNDHQAVLRSGDVTALAQLDQDGAWSPAEVTQFLTRPSDLYAAGLISEVETRMGTMTVLMPDGYAVARGKAGAGPSAARQLDRAYVRLCLQELGWRLVGNGPLTEMDTSGRMVEAETPFGAALVVGKLPRGYSVKGLEAVVNRLKSQALYHGFWIISLTPQPRRGRHVAEEHPALVKVLHLCPQVGSSGQPQVKPGRDAPTVFRGPLGVGREQEFLAITAQKGRPYGQPWLDVLAHDWAGRLTLALEALECDGVLSERQLERYFALGRHEFDGVPYVDVQVQPVHSRRSLVVQDRFFVRATRQRGFAWSTLMHSVGLAEMRLLLGVAPDMNIWQTTQLGRSDAVKPDAIYHAPDGRISVDYDTGSYARAVIVKKLEAFKDQGYEETIWGVPGSERAATLRQDLQLQVLHTRWYNEPTKTK